MAYIPKLLVLGRCVRCGKKVHKGDLFFKCPECKETYYCVTCYEKTFHECAICGAELVEA